MDRQEMINLLKKYPEDKILVWYKRLYNMTVKDLLNDLNNTKDHVEAVRMYTELRESGCLVVQYESGFALLVDGEDSLKTPEKQYRRYTAIEAIALINDLSKKVMFHDTPLVISSVRVYETFSYHIILDGKIIYGEDIYLDNAKFEEYFFEDGTPCKKEMDAKDMR